MSTRGTRVKIPILGMNNQLLDDQSADGLCDSLVNLKPKGALEQPYWAPFEKINTLKNDSSENFTYEFGLSSITDAFWQVRNFIGEFSDDTEGSLKRLLVLCQNDSRKCIDIIEPSTWAVVKTQALPQEGVYTWSCTRVDDMTVIAISRDKKPYLLYYLKDDTFIPSGWPDMPTITFTTTTETIDSGEVTAGNTKGVMRKAVDQWFMVTWAFRLFDGTIVKHNAPILVKVDSGATDEAVIPVFTLDGYSEAELLLISPFWKNLIAGIGVFATIPREVEQTALDDGAFFRVGYWAWMDKLPADQWPTATDPNILTIELKSESWPTGDDLPIDNFTHHRFSARIADTFNKRLLLGGRALDFALPKIKTNAFSSTIPGGVYSDYFTFHPPGAYTQSYTWYDSDGNPMDFTQPWDYEVSYLDILALWNPKAGRAFKAVVILESNDGGMVVSTPNGQSVPATNYSAAIDGDGRLLLAMDVLEATITDGFLTGPPSMRIQLDIGPTVGVADQRIFFTVLPSGNTAPYLQFSNIELEAEESADTVSIYHRITIKTDTGVYYRVLEQQIAEAETEVNLPNLIWYPDRRATLYELIVQNGANFELALSRQLIQHPESNYAYVYLATADQTYTIGDSLVTVTQPSLAVNDLFQYIPNLIAASLSGNALIFDPAASYRVGNRENDTILGFAINLNPTSEGQAGQYPVYAFSDKGIWALEQTGDPTIAFGRISPVSNFNGINNPYAYCNAQNLIIATDNKYIYALAGLEAKRIDEAIANDPDYKDYLKQIRIGYHRASDYEEVIFSNPFYDYSLCYNLKYQVWYKATERFKFFFYDYPELMGLTVDNVLKDFSDKDIESPVAWSLVTRVIQYQEPYVYKRLYPFHVRMQVRQPLQENAEDYLPLRMQLKGYRDDQNIVYSLIDQSIKSDVVYDPRIYNQYGSMYAFRIYLDGTSNHKNGDIKWFDTDMEYRYQETRRRHNCSAQYLYTMEASGMSICHCEGGSGTDAYFPFEGPATESIVITHNLMKVPSRPFVTDLDGHLIECGVQLILTEGIPSLTQIRLTFDDPKPFKAYFN